MSLTFAAPEIGVKLVSVCSCCTAKQKHFCITLQGVFRFKPLLWSTTFHRGNNLCSSSNTSDSCCHTICSNYSLWLWMNWVRSDPIRYDTIRVQVKVWVRAETWLFHKWVHNVQRFGKRGKHEKRKTFIITNKAGSLHCTDKNNLQIMLYYYHFIRETMLCKHALSAKSNPESSVWNHH